MIDERLREEMEEAFLRGDKDEALRLSQKLDNQIIEHYKGKKQEGAA